MLESFIRVTSYVFIIYFLIINSFYALLIFLSLPSIYRRFREVEYENLDALKFSETLPPIAIIIPVYNEQEQIRATIQNVTEIDYPAKEIIIVNDGSKDTTLSILKDELKLISAFSVANASIPTQEVKQVYRSEFNNSIIVIDKKNGGRADSLNCGLNFSLSPYYLAVDADTVLQKDALVRMIRPFFSKKDLIAQGGTIRILNGCKIKEGRVHSIGLPKNFFANIQVVEYLRAFLYGRLGWNYLGGDLLISGAFGFFDRKVVIECGGYDAKNITEDFELTVRMTKMHRKKGKKMTVMFIPDPVAWTIVPEKYHRLSTQRIRWHQGLIETMVKFKSMIFNPKYGPAGMIAMPYYLFAELLEPIVEFVGYIFIILALIFGYIGWKILTLYFLVSFGITILLSFVALIMEVSTFRQYRLLRQFAKLLFYSFMENFGFRQLYVLWRLKAFWSYIVGKKVW